MNDTPDNSNIIPLLAKAASPSRCRETLATIAQCEEALKPSGEKFGTGQLLACLTLVAPSGLTAGDRNEWVRVAKETLTGIPGDLLQWGCQEARLTCRFPSEIVPAIVAAVRDEWDRRKRALGHAIAAEQNRNAPRLQHKPAEPEYITADDFRELMKMHFGQGDAA